MANPIGVNGSFCPECRECRAGYSQAVRCMIGFKCTEHGIMSYDANAAIEGAITQEAQRWAHSTQLDGDIIRELKVEIANLKRQLAESRGENSTYEREPGTITVCHQYTSPDTPGYDPRTDDLGNQRQRYGRGV